MYFFTKNETQTRTKFTLKQFEINAFLSLIILESVQFDDVLDLTPYAAASRNGPCKRSNLSFYSCKKFTLKKSK